MRTTVDLPPVVHRRVRELAAQNGVSMSSMLADLTVRGLAQFGEPVEVRINERTGLPMLSVGRTVTAHQVEDALAE